MYQRALIRVDSHKKQAVLEIKIALEGISLDGITRRDPICALIGQILILESLLSVQPWRQAFRSIFRLSRTVKPGFALNLLQPYWEQKHPNLPSWGVNPQRKNGVPERCEFKVFALRRLDLSR